MVEISIEILLVDDNTNDIELAVYALKRSECIHQVQVARDGVEALDFLFCTGPYAQRSIANLPRLVLLDLKLPRIDGWEVLQRIKSDPRTQFIPVVIMTSSSDQKDIARCYQLGANSYIIKPVDYVEFTQLARTLCTYWLTINRLPNG